MKTKLAILVGLVVLGVGGTALADACKSPKVKIVNDKAQTIKVSKIQYFDGCDNKWRTEDVENREIEPTRNTIYTDKLEYVGNCKITKFKLYRAVRQQTGPAYGPYEWGGELVADEGANQVCNTNVKFTVHAHD